MKTLKKASNAIYLALATTTPALANSALFSSAESKVKEFNSGLLTIGVLILTLAIMVSALGAALGWFSKATALKIFGGGLVFGLASTIASWLAGTGS
jgi:hypothetical protein